MIVEAIIPSFDIVNPGSSPVALQELTIRYYFTRDSQTAALESQCSWTALPGTCANITTQTVLLPTPLDGADAYLEIGFTSGAGAVAANSQTLEIIAYVNKADWTDFDQHNDYSFDPTSQGAVFIDWNKVTLYRNGVLIWGTPPT